MTAAGSEPIGVSAVARHLFGPAFAQASAFAQLLAGPGVERGLLGPREVEWLWDRHLVNCALVAELVPEGSRVVDVGSGAGLPGVALAIRRPDLRVDLVEPLLRRTTFLDEVVETLGLGDRVRVVRGRADEPGVVLEVGGASWVTARAVAPLGRLVRWCLPLLDRGGTVLALKGAQAENEIEQARAELRSLAVDVIGIDEPTLDGHRVRVVRLRRAVAQ